MQNPTKKRVLILCTGNSCRSQMAEGIATHLFSDQYEVFSAGTHPSTVNPNAIEVMKELNIDISNYRSKNLLEFIDQQFDYIMTVCGNADQACPVFPGPAKRIHWGFSDPVHATGTKEEILSEFRKVRDDIDQKFKKDWLNQLV